MGKNQHVVPREDGWAVKSEGASKASVIKQTQEQAIKVAVKIAKKEESEVLIHGRDGRIRARESYGHDPFPPRDREH